MTSVAMIKHDPEGLGREDLSVQLTPVGPIYLPDGSQLNPQNTGMINCNLTWQIIYACGFNVITFKIESSFKAPVYDETIGSVFRLCLITLTSKLS